ncbi:(Fe-S)-binding protein [Desulfohalovibrio reitneri]|uniref:(Fe-S)-binding protein n=1 Tax=Desulfohalovibrio reitneri TaxID=1307759 RepID=UPI00068C78F5|nr:(Fe-S)-binding protein [Desulfohalovibrio reitneri]
MSGLHAEKNTVRCVGCGRCLAVCPLFAATNREELSPRAKFVLRQGSETGEVDAGDAAGLAALCLSCGRCEAACPEGLCAPDLAAEMRAENSGWREWVWGRWINWAGALWPLARTASRLPLPKSPAIAAARALDGPRPAPEPWLRVRFVTTGEFPCDQRAKAVLFSGCTARHARPEWRRKATALLTGLGFETVADPGFACCGCTLGHAGLLQERDRLRRANLQAWRDAGRPLVAVFCATCRCGLRAYARADLGWEEGEREAWLEAVKPLAGLLEGAEFEVLDKAPARIVYHRPCHGSGGDRDGPLLERALGGRLKRGPEDACCGFGGVMQLGAPDLSQAVAGTLWERLVAGGAEDARVLTGCSGCVVQLSATAPTGAGADHWLDALAVDNT